MRRLRSALFHLIYAYAPGFGRCGALLRKPLSYPPKKSSFDDFFCPQRGASTLNLIAITKRCPTLAIAGTNRHNPKLATNH